MTNNDRNGCAWRRPATRVAVGPGSAVGALEPARSTRPESHAILPGVNPELEREVIGQTLRYSLHGDLVVYAALAYLGTKPDPALLALLEQLR